MRKLAAIALIVSAPALACPDLTGIYTCTYPDGVQETATITQYVGADGVTVFNYNGTEIRADNQIYTVPEDDVIKGGTFRAWCEDSVTLKGQMNGKYYSSGTYFGELRMNLEFSKVESDLQLVTTGEMKNSGGNYPLNSDVRCVAN